MCHVSGPRALSIVYVGFRTSAIWYDPERKLWIWVSRKLPNSTATSQSRSDGYFLGRNLVDFSGSSDLCMEGRDTKEASIKLTACLEEDFTCDDGHCIPMERRCDQTPNCRDGSDEKSCRMLVRNDNYNKRVPPFTVSQDTFSIIPVTVQISVVVLNVLKLQEVEHEFYLKFTIRMSWFDHRLKFHNLKVRQSSNALTVDEINSLWTPSIVFSNTHNNEVTAGTEDAQLTVAREGNYTKSGTDSVEEEYIFLGNENKITFEMTYSKIFGCEYQLSMYPFDTQRCTMDMTVKKLEREVLKLDPKSVQMLGQVMLTQYVIKSWELAYRNTSNLADGIHVVIILRRRIVNELLTTYLPSIIILVIVYSTNYLKPRFLEAALTINLTSMLVLTTLFISVSNSLPKTAYIKVENYIIQKL